MGRGPSEWGLRGPSTHPQRVPQRHRHQTQAGSAAPYTPSPRPGASHRPLHAGPLSPRCKRRLQGPWGRRTPRYRTLRLVRSLEAGPILLTVHLGRVPRRSLENGQDPTLGSPRAVENDLSRAEGMPTMATPEVPPPPTEQQETALVLGCDWSRTRRPRCLVVNVVSVLYFHPHPPARPPHILHSPWQRQATSRGALGNGELRKKTGRSVPLLPFKGAAPRFPPAEIVAQQVTRVLGLGQQAVRRPLGNHLLPLRVSSENTIFLMETLFSNLKCLSNSVIPKLWSLNQHHWGTG